MGLHRIRHLLPLSGLCAYISLREDESTRYIHITNRKRVRWQRQHVHCRQDTQNRRYFIHINIAAKLGGCLFRYVSGIRVGKNCAPLLAKLFLYLYECEFLDSMISSGHGRLVTLFSCVTDTWMI